MLASKLIILTGAKYSTIRNLRYDDLNTEVNTLKINSYTIRLPETLSKQFHTFKKLRTEAFHINSTYLFCNENGKQWSKGAPSASIVDLLSVIVMRMDTTGLTKYGIYHLLKSGMSIKEIEELTGAKADIIRGCMHNDINSDQEALLNKHINMCLSQIDCYYSL